MRRRNSRGGMACGTNQRRVACITTLLMAIIPLSGLSVGRSSPVIATASTPTVGEWRDTTPPTNCGASSSQCGVNYKSAMTLLDPPLCHRPIHPAYPCGSVLVVGDSSNSPDPSGQGQTYAELYDPSHETWRPMPPLPQALYGPSGPTLDRLLPNGKVLVVGLTVFGGTGLLPNPSWYAGWLYDPGLPDPQGTFTGSWTSTGSMPSFILGLGTLTVLDGPARLGCRYCGQVLLAGAFLPGQRGALYDPAAGTWSATPGVMEDGFTDHTATLLPSGQVLLANGFPADYDKNSHDRAELFDPVTGLFIPTENVPIGARGAEAVLIPAGPAAVCGGYCGKVAVMGGDVGDGYVSGFKQSHAVAVYAPVGPTAGLWSIAPLSMPTARNSGSALALANGSILMVGGNTQPDGSPDEVFDPAATTQAIAWRPTSGSHPQGPPVASVKLARGPLAACGDNCNKVLVGVRADNWPSYPPIVGAALYTSPPSVDPVHVQACAPLSGGTDVVLTGSGLEGAALAGGSVAFGTQPARAVVRDNDLPDEKLVVKSPPFAGGATAVPVTVTTHGGTATAVGTFNYDPGCAIPAVTGVIPSSGPASGGTTVTITGTGLTTVRGVEFGRVAASVVHPDPATPDLKVTAVSPRHPAGPVDVTVTTARGTSAATSADVFTYVGAFSTGLNGGDRGSNTPSGPPGTQHLGPPGALVSGTAPGPATSAVYASAVASAPGPPHLPGPPVLPGSATVPHSATWLVPGGGLELAAPGAAPIPSESVEPAPSFRMAGRTRNGEWADGYACPALGGVAVVAGCVIWRRRRTAGAIRAAPRIAH